MAPENRCEVLRARAAERLETFLQDLHLLSGIDCGTANTEGVNQVGAWVRARCARNGWATRVHAGARRADVVEARVPGSGTVRILLLAHMDTVYPDGTAAERPMRTEGSKIVGPGTSDMKGGLLAGIYAVEALQWSGHTPFAEVVLLFTGDEEIGSPESSALTTEIARTCHAALVLEAARASGAIVAARKGIIDYRIDVQGRSAHAGVEPEKGRSAILEVAHKVIALQALNGTVPGATVNVGLAGGGTALNVVPETAFAKFEARALDPEGLDRIDAAIREVVAATSVPDTTTKLTAHRGFPPMARTPAIERLATLAKQTARDLGFEIEAVATGGASDACQVASVGTPVLDGLGPVGGDDHSPREWLLLDSIVPRVALLGELIARIAEREP